MKRLHEDWVHNIKLDHGRRATLVLDLASVLG